MNREDYEDYEDLEENEDFEENEDYEDSYEDEEYDDDEEYDEDEEYDGLSAEELELIATDYSEPISEDSIEELSYLLDRYFKIQEISPEYDEEEELKQYALEVIRAIVMEYEIPTYDLFYLFKFVLTLEFYAEKNSSDIIFTEVDAEEDIKTLKLRVDEYLNDNPDIFNDFEVYESLFDIDKSLRKTKLYDKTLDNFYKTLIDNASLESFGVMVDLYATKREKADKYFAQMPMPCDTIDEIAYVLCLLTNCNNTGSLLNKRLDEAKKIIAQKYPNDELLKQMIEDLDYKQSNLQQAKIYKVIKFGSLAIAILLLLVHWIVGFIACIGWGAIFFTSLHDRIPFLVKGVYNHLILSHP